MDSPASRRYTRVSASLILLCAGVAPALAISQGPPSAQSGVVSLGVPPGSGIWPMVVSDDGSTVLISATVTQSILRWTAADGPTPLPLPAGAEAWVEHMSRDGHLIVGSVLAAPDFQYKLTVWEAGGPPRPIDQLGAYSAYCMAISRDGRWIAGTCQDPNAQLHTEEGFLTSSLQGVGVETIDALGPAGSVASPSAVSDDGRVVAGTSWFGPSGSARAFRWTRSGGTLALSPPGNEQEYRVLMSADGSVAAWLRTRPSGSFGFDVVRWTTAGGAVVLGGPSGESVSRIFLSDDGTTIFGNSERGGFKWSEASGFTRPFGDPTLRVTALSPDGQVAALEQTVPGQILGNRIFRWSAASGIRELDRLSTGLFPWHGVTAISYDGAEMVGSTDSGGVSAMWRENGTVGTETCGPGAPNSTGVPGTLQVLGSNVVSVASVSLLATDLPPGAAGFFLASNESVPPMPVASSEGWLCLGGRVGRYVGPGQIQSAGALGDFTLSIDPAAIATAMGPALPLFGEAWSFQAWHRDANPGPTSNLTSAVTVRFY